MSAPDPANAAPEIYARLVAIGRGKRVRHIAERYIADALDTFAFSRLSYEQSRSARAPTGEPGALSDEQADAMGLAWLDAWRDNGGNLRAAIRAAWAARPSPVGPTPDASRKETLAASPVEGGKPTTKPGEP